MDIIEIIKKRISTRTFNHVALKTADKKNLEGFMNENIRIALPGEFEILTEIAFAAKRSWNYPESYFEIWKDGEEVHIRHCEVSKECYCPAANYRTTKPNDIHCECTRNSHKAIFETALGKSFEVDIVETVRRGGKTCHFIVHLGLNE